MFTQQLALGRRPTEFDCIRVHEFIEIVLFHQFGGKRYGGLSPQKNLHFSATKSTSICACGLSTCNQFHSVQRISLSIQNAELVCVCKDFIHSCHRSLCSSFQFGLLLAIFLARCLFQRQSLFFLKTCYTDSYSLCHSLYLSFSCRADGFVCFNAASMSSVHTGSISSLGRGVARPPVFSEGQMDKTSVNESA